MGDAPGTRAIHLSPWRVDVTERPGVPRPVPLGTLARAIARALDAGGAPRPAAVGLILADDAELARLNHEHMGHDGPTDVLSFPLLPPAAFPPHEGQDASVRLADPAALYTPPRPRTALGDIVVSVERAIDQARSGRGGHDGDSGWSATQELMLLVVHGTLHVCGWDHVLPQEAAAMRALETELLAAP